MSGAVLSTVDVAYLLISELRERVDDDAKDKVEADRRHDDEERYFVDWQQDEVIEPVALSLFMASKSLQPQITQHLVRTTRTTSRSFVYGSQHNISTYNEFN